MPTGKPSQMPQVLIRADASPQIGGGHVVRTLSLGLALQEAGFEVSFATRPETHATIPFLGDCGFRLIGLDCPVEHETSTLREHFPHGLEAMVIDHYQRGISFEKQCRQFCRSLMVLDDEPLRAHDCDLLLDQTLGRQPQEYRGWVAADCRILAGTAFALLRPQFARARSRLALQPRKALNRLLLMSGASDPLNLTGWVLKALAELPESLNLDVIGSGPTDFATHHQARFHGNVADVAAFMAAADLAIGAAGSASWERCCLGLPSLLFVIAENQRQIGLQLERAGVARNLGRPGELKAGEFCDLLRQIRAHPDWLTSASLRSFELCDGQGASRAARALQESLKPPEEPP